MHHVEIISGAVCVLFCFVFAGSGGECGREGYVALTAAEFSYQAAAEYAVRAVTGQEPPKAFVPSPAIVAGKTLR